MTELPSGWRWATVEELAGSDRSNIVIGPFGSSLKVNDYQDSGVPLVFVRNIRARNFAGGQRFVSLDKAVELAAHQVIAGDVLVTKMGDPPGDAALYRQPEPSIITADCIRIRPGPEVLAEYLSLAFETSIVRDQISAITRGVAQKKVSLERFRQGVRIPLAPIWEQRRIVDFLEGYRSRLDAAIGLLERSRLRLTALEAATLSEAREGQSVALKDVAVIQGGIQKQPKRAPRDNAYHFLRVANVTRDGLDLSDVHLVELFGGELERLRLEAGDLLVVEGNGSASQIGRAALWDGSVPNCVHQNHLIRVRPYPTILSEYLEAVWNSPENREQLTKRASSSSGLYTLSVSKLSSLPIPVPSIDRQLRAIARTRRIRDAINRLEAEIDAATAHAGGLRRSLLGLAFAGRLYGKAAEIERGGELARV